MTQKKGLISVSSEPNFNPTRLPLPNNQTVTQMDGYDAQSESSTSEPKDEGGNSPNNLMVPTCLLGASQSMKVTGTLNLPSPSQIAKSLLIQSLVEQLILFHEEEPNKRKKLFRTICQRLSDMKFIDPLWNVEIMNSQRLQFNSSFGNLIRSIKISENNSSPTNPFLNAAIFSTNCTTALDLDRLYNLTSETFEDSRYESDFEEIQVIARGGFGTVCKALKRVDKVEYAVKKIPFTCKSDPLVRKVLREVELFARLLHPNVVNYKSAWIEHRSVMNSSVAMVSSSVLEEEEEDDEEESYSSLEVMERSQIEVMDGPLVPFSGTPGPPPFLRSCSLHNQPYSATLRSVLFIQMELCRGGSLRDWLEVRGRRLDQSMDIFKQLVRGVQYIHSEGLIHRDLKPLNILFDEKQETVKIADFGLSTICCSGSATDEEFCLSESCERCSPDGVDDKHSKVAGTSPYAAPEQKKRSNYTNKADMYSLGVILLELLSPFGTSMELSRALEALQLKGSLPEHLTKDYSDLQCEAIRNLLNRDPEKRPSAQQLLESELFSTKAQIIIQQCDELAKLRKTLSSRDEELVRLRRMLELKDEELRRLKLQLSQILLEHHQITP